MVSDKQRRRVVAAGAGASLRGLVTVYRNNIQRVFHAALLVALLGLVIAVPLYGVQTGVVTVFLPLLVVAVLVKAGQARPNLVFAIGSVVVAWVLLTHVINPALASPVVPVPIPLGVYILPVAAALAPFMFPENRPGTRGVAALMGQVPVLLAAGLAVYSPLWATVLAVVLILAVNLLFGGGRMFLSNWRAFARSGINPTRRARSQPNSKRARQFDEVNVQRGIEAEIATAAELERLPAGWTVLHSRALPGSHADVDHLVVGPPAVFVVDSKDWKGKLSTRQTPDGTTDGVINGSPEKFARAIETVRFEAEQVATQLNLSPDEIRGVLAFTGRMALPGGATSVPTAPGMVVDIVAISDVADHLASLPPRHWAGLSASARNKAAKRGKSLAEAQAAADARFCQDLAATADYAFPIKRA